MHKYPKNKPFVYKNKINLHIENVSKDDKVIINSRLGTQLDDSSRVKVKDVIFLKHIINTPPAFDSASANRSAENMEASMAYLGFFSSEATHKETIQKKGDQQRVTVTYDVTAGKRTLIDTFGYLFNKQALQNLAVKTKDQSPLQKNTPITRAAVQTENARLVDLYRNSGYYKVSPEDFRLTGDTTIEALTNATNDPFEELRLLSEANAQRNKPTIKLTMVLNSTPDSTKFRKYFIDSIYVLPDYVPGDNYKDSSLHATHINGYIFKYHNLEFSNNLIANRITLKKNGYYKQEDYYNTINNIYKLNVWETPAIDIIEKQDSLLDLVIKLIPVKRKTFEGSVELSYSANSNTSNVISTTNSGNLLGLYGNLSLSDRNVKKRAIRMTNALRGGIEFNTAGKNSNGTLINSNELSFTNNIFIPNKRKTYKEFFTELTLSQINRIDFFNQQILNLGAGFVISKKANQSLTIRPFNMDFRRIYNQTARFDSTLALYPFLRYSFNTALVLGASANYVLTYTNAKHPKRNNVLRINLEESGLPYNFLKDALSANGADNFLKRYLKEFVKWDGEYIHTWSYAKTALATRLFVGVGIPISKSDTTLPFFKQYYSGGPNSMRGWPVRGIGVGGQPLAPYNTTSFNDRTGDIKLEGNLEYRYNIAPLFSNTLVLKGALFVDAGNIWNWKNTRPDGTTDTTQFQFANLYKELGVSAGTGFRLDFNYFVVRFDLGFRFKRPDVLANDGWQFPNINFANIFGSKVENKIWRYENFNFTIGVDYPF